jgi:SAM-dependent methyltransferase
MRGRPTQRQREYYQLTSATYDAAHLCEGDEHNAALKFVSAFTKAFGYRSMLDVGCGTGRTVVAILDEFPDVHMRGVEPVRGMIDQARAKGVPDDVIELGVGEKLPFADNSFDAVCEFGVLHHVPDPAPVIEEMKRVASRAIFLSDHNRFAEGSVPVRLTKLALAKVGLWNRVYWLRTGGRGYNVSEGDGLAYSYSVYDSYRPLVEWANTVALVPIRPASSGTWLSPLLSSSHVLLCAFRD